ncbi:MAG: cytochrome c maturation protein CcmE [Actinomycetia bacterium]|nr:cytochrome c maturation protein CcmE [Actinomycetes bacterium]
MDVTDDPESPDAEPVNGEGAPSAPGSADFDLAPRTGPSSAAAPRSSRRWIPLVAIVLLLAALGFVLFQGLNDAATFFYNVDEAVEQRSDLEGERFRMQGNVVEGSVEQTDTGVDFVITFEGVEMPVTHTGTPPELFGSQIPVVLEGSFEGDGFASDEILIRHDNEYDEENPDRVADAERDAQALAGDPAEGAGPR